MIVVAVLDALDVQDVDDVSTLRHGTPFSPACAVTRRPASRARR